MFNIVVSVLVARCVAPPVPLTIAPHLYQKSLQFGRQYTSVVDPDSEFDLPDVNALIVDEALLAEHGSHFHLAFCRCLSSTLPFIGQKRRLDMMW
jgi:hypothetical protein